jgi:hypothetical protein
MRFFDYLYLRDNNNNNFHKSLSVRGYALCILSHLILTTPFYERGNGDSEGRTDLSKFLPRSN